jgi:hypothetical protein
MIEEVPRKEPNDVVELPSSLPSNAPPSPESQISGLPGSIQSVLSKCPEEARTFLSLALSRTSFGFGPDAETMKVLAETERHEETCRLKGFEASLANRDKQADRDHEFRKRRLNHQSLMSGAILVVTILGVAAGILISWSGNPSTGNPVLIVSATVLAAIAGKFISARDRD